MFDVLHSIQKNKQTHKNRSKLATQGSRRTEFQHSSPLHSVLVFNMSESLGNRMENGMKSWKQTVGESIATVTDRCQTDISRLTASSLLALPQGPKET